MRFWSTLIIYLIATLVLYQPVAARDIIPGPVPAQAIRVIDGDTLRVKASIWVGQLVTVNVRVRGIDTPELHGGCRFERQQAKKARAFAQAFVFAQPTENRILLINIENGKYAGRVVASVQTPDGNDLAAALILAGLARPYNGGHKTGWCPKNQRRSGDVRED